MEPFAIIEEIRKLPVSDQLKIIEKTAKMIERESETAANEKAAAYLYEDYKNNMELISFNDLDCEDFYETR
jgi:hypothetical protein